MAIPPEDDVKSDTGATILIVEDEEPIRRLMSRMLELQGYEILQASDGMEALSTCEQHAGYLDLIITDMVMPKLNGKKLVEQLKQKREGLKVLFMSGYSSDDTVDGEPIGIDVAFIAKPFTHEALTEKVREVLERG